MQITAEIRNQKAVEHLLAQLSGKQASQAYAKALNDAGFQVHRNMQAALRTSFDRVTPWIERSAWVFPAKAEQLSVSVGPRLGKRVGMDPQKILQAQEFGGRRADKRSESALRRAGILPMGFQTAIPATPFPGSDDGRGNLRGAFLQQLLSYLQAYSEQGYRANMTDKKRAGIQRGSKRAEGRRYFVSYGRWREGRGAHLAPGIWAASGTGGAVLRPVLMFVRPGKYQPRISMDKIAQQSNLQDYLDKRVRFRIREAAGV